MTPELIFYFLISIHLYCLFYLLSSGKPIFIHWKSKFNWFVTNFTRCNFLMYCFITYLVSSLSLTFQFFVLLLADDEDDEDANEDVHPKTKGKKKDSKVDSKETKGEKKVPQSKRSKKVSSCVTLFLFLGWISRKIFLSTILSLIFSRPRPKLRNRSSSKQQLSNASRINASHWLIHNVYFLFLDSKPDLLTMESEDDSDFQPRKKVKQEVPGSINFCKYIVVQFP